MQIMCADPREYRQQGLREAELDCCRRAIGALQREIDSERRGGSRIAPCPRKGAEDIVELGRLAPCALPGGGRAREPDRGP
eukprot:15444855-Alexandrium_andersonii.AAC.1